MLVELGLVEQRYRAVLEVLNDGASVTEVARRFGVARQTVHVWLRNYACGGLGALADRSSRPASCPHQMSPLVEARVVAMRTEHPGWGSRTIVYWLAREGLDPVPGRTSVDRCLVRHGLITPTPRRRKRSDYRRWERSAAMDLWQMDVVGGVRLVDGAEAKIVSGIDDHSRFVVSAQVVARATAGPVCAALELAIDRFGAPRQILTDNGKVFTARFGPGPGPVRFDRICAGHDIGHLLTAPRSPTTTGKVERWHKTLRKEFLTGKVFVSIDDAQDQLDAWVHEYNHQRPHQSIGRVPPFERFRLAPPRQAAAVVAAPPARIQETGPTLVVSRAGTVSFAGIRYPVGAWLAGQRVQVACDGGLVQISHAGVLVATLARRHDPARQTPAARRATPPRPPRPTLSAAAVTRKVDSSGNVSFAGVAYRVGAAWRRRQVKVAVVGRTVEISADTQLIRTHTARHNPTREQFLALDPAHSERQLEDALVAKLSAFLTELGQGFAFVGRQYRLPVGDREFFADLIFFHLGLRRFVVFELKVGPVEPEHLGKLADLITDVTDPE